MKVILAPMEGLVDYWVRQSLTAIGGFDHCVSEFIRVSDLLLPERVFKRMVPEIDQDWKTLSGTPVHLQLLGSNPDTMAANARRAALLGAPAIDLNFGCPAKTVNKNMGGSILLREPNTIENIVKSVREAVPSSTPVTAKMRLGFEDNSLALENALAMQEGGASSLCIHARTKSDGYKPPAYWPEIAKIRNKIDIPIIANGEVWTPEDYTKCQQQSLCDDIMIGRGAIRRPDLALRIKAMQNGSPLAPMQWLDILNMIIKYIDTIRNSGKEKFVISRIKQWLNFIALAYDEAIPLFNQIKRMLSLQEIEDTVFEEYRKEMKH